MTSAHSMAQRPGDDADARFAAYLADVAAHIDDPHHGEEYRAILDEDPEIQRAWFDVVGDMSAAPIGNPAALVWTGIVVLVATAVVVVFAVGWLP